MVLLAELGSRVKKVGEASQDEELVVYQEDGAYGTYITGIWAAKDHINLVLGGVGVSSKSPIAYLSRSS